MIPSTFRHLKAWVRSHAYSQSALLASVIAISACVATSTDAVFTGSTTSGISAATAVSYPACNQDYKAAITSTSGLTNYWRLGDKTGNNAAATTGGLDGTYFGNPTLNRPPARSAMGTDGSVEVNGSQSVNVGDINDFSGTSSYSIELWVKRTTATVGYPFIIDKQIFSPQRSGWTVFMGPSEDGYYIGAERFDATGVSDDVYTNSPLLLDRWYHVVITYSSTSFAMYLDGVLENSFTPTRSLPNTTAHMVIGGSYVGGIDEVSIYNTALSPATVASHYKGCSGSVAGPVPTHVQSQSSTSDASATSGTSAFATDVAAGDAIVVATAYRSNTTFTCSDSRGNAYATAISTYDATSDFSVGVCYSVNVSGGANTVTVTYGAAVARNRVLAHEYRGVSRLNPLDVTAVNIAAGTTTANAVTSNAATTTTPNNLVFGAVMNLAGTSTIVAGTGFTQRTSTNGKDFASQDQSQSTAGAIASTQTFGTAHRYAAVMIALRPSGAAAPALTGPTPPTMAYFGESARDLATNPKTINSISVQAGDILVAQGATSDSFTTLNTPTGGTGITWTLRGSVTSVDHAPTYVWTAPVTTTQVVNLSVSRSGSTNEIFGFFVKVWRGSTGVGASAIASAPTSSATSPATVNLTTQQANSAIDVIDADWAASATAPTWLTGAGVFTEQRFQNYAGKVSFGTGYHANAGAAGLKTIGQSAPNQVYSIGAVEILGTP